MHVKTDTGDDFIVEDDGNVIAQQIAVTGQVKGLTYANTNGNFSVSSTGVLDCVTIDTGQGDNEVYGLVTPEDSSDGGANISTIEVEQGSIQGDVAPKYKVKANSISDDELQFNTGQHLTTSAVGGTPDFRRIGVGASADGTYAVKISSAVQKKIQLDDLSLIHI